MNYIIMPVLAGPDMTEAAIADCLAQSVPTRVLVINQGVDSAFRERLERLVDAHDDRLLLWSHEPPLLSLAASWNRALDFVWEAGGTEALVVNNDVRLHRDTLRWLRASLIEFNALFVTAVGVTAEQFDTNCDLSLTTQAGRKGGPDFSCYLISKACHDKYRFDEHFIPAYCEDLDYHRRLMLDGVGDKIFSVNLPYLHLAAQTLKTVDPQKRMAIERAIGQGSRAYYRKKWGGDVNQETYKSPFNADGFEFTDDSATTPALQRALMGPPIDQLCKEMLEK